MTETTYTFWIKVAPTEIEGQWVAHCPDFDVMSQGNGPAHAVQMLHEALAMSIVDDVVNNIDPHSHRVPVAEWDAFMTMVRRSKACTLEAGIRARATLITSGSMTVRQPTLERKAPEESGILPTCDSVEMPAYVCA